MKRLLVICLIPLLLCGGCAWFETSEPELSAQELIGRGMDDYNNGSYKDAIESFEKLRDWYPFSKYAILAEYKIADAYYLMDEFAEALLAYEEFESLHPRNEVVPYVVYQMGMCWFNRIDTVDRDQTSAGKALEIFTRLTGQFPGDKYAVKGQEKLLFCLENLAGHDMYVGKFYFKTEHYKGALGRFQGVVDAYPELPELQAEAMENIALCEEALNGADVDLPGEDKKWYQLW